MAEFYNLYGGAMIDQVIQPPIQQQPNNKQNNKPNNKQNNKPNNKQNNKPNNQNNDSNNNGNDGDGNNTANNLNNEVKERIASIKINTNKSVLVFWIMWLISVILLLSTYITSPIRYSKKRIFSYVSYNRFYYYLYVILLGLLCYFAYQSGEKMPLVKGEDVYQKVAPITVFILGFLVLNIFDEPGIKEDGSFNSAPSVLIKNKIGMLFHYIFLVLFLIGLIAINLYYSSDSFLGLQEYHIVACMPAIIVGVMCLYMLYLTARYRIKKYNLPNTWRK
jgi:hypothetical protein